MLAAVAVKTSQCYLGLGDYSSPKLVYSSSDCQPSPSYSYRPHPSTDGRLSPEPSQADLGLFSHSTIPTMALLGMTSRGSNQCAPFSPCLCSSWQGSWQASLSRRDSFPSTAYQTGVAASAWKSRKKKEITLQIPEILKFPNRQTSCLPRATLPNDCRNLGSLV